MKWIRIVWITGMIFFFGTHILQAQQAWTKYDQRIEPLPLTVACAKTTNLIFPYSIKSVDRGNRDLLVQKAKGVENILQLKAASPQMEETNLTVITSDGVLYSFILSYAPDPSTLNLKLSNRHLPQSARALFPSPEDNDAMIRDRMVQVLVKRRTVRGRKDDRFDISMELIGLYVREGIYYFQFEFENNSNINYDVEQFRFFIRDKKTPKRTAYQETEQSPLMISGNVQLIRGQTKQRAVVALSKFTMPDRKYLCIQLMEHNGGRHLELKLKNRHLIRALALPSM